MSDAQLGLLTATPIIIAFAGTLRAMGVLSTTATVFAVGLSIAIARGAVHDAVARSGKPYSENSVVARVIR
jgi:hypothetical protein